MKWIGFLLALALLASNFNLYGAGEDDPKLKAILAAYDKREEGESAREAHRAWLKTTTGREEAAYLAERYESLHDMRKYEVPTELARTGAPEIVPLVTKTLADGKNGRHVLAGIFYACQLAGAGDDFRHAVAPGVVPWVGKGIVSGQDAAVELLPQLDGPLAARILLTDEFVSKDAPLVHVVLASFNDVGMEVPRPPIQKLLDAWKSTGTDQSSEYRIRKGYREAVRALAVHDPRQALDIAERIVRENPRESEAYSEIPLAAAGLTGLYESLCDSADDPAKFAKLPEIARIYFAVGCFEADCSNGGIEQALGNSTGDYLPLVRKGYQEIGDPRSFQFVEWMCKPFGPEGPSTDRTARIHQMASMTPTYDEQVEPLREAWEKQDKDPSLVSTEWLLNRYAAAHAKVMKPLVKGVKK
jgi:Domain of unknown function (DUF4375)